MIEYAIILYIIIMNWEHLPKNAVDSETIEQAITRIVQQHNNDNTAHMGTGQSIDVHRKEPVIDHKAGSVLADKETMSEFKFYTTFESLDTWDVVGQVSNAGILGCQMYVENGSIDKSSINVTNVTLGNFLNTYKDMMFQTLLNFDMSAGTYQARFGQISNFNTSLEGFGFLVSNGVLSTYVGDSNFSNQVQHYSISVSTAHIYRAQYIAGERTFYFFVDSVLIHTYVLPAQNNLESDTGLFIGIDIGNSSDGNLNVTNLNYARSI